MCLVLRSHRKNSWKHWAGAALSASALILWQSLVANALPTPFRARSCAMGTHPVLRAINAAAPAVATPAVETFPEVCLLALWGRNPCRTLVFGGRHLWPAYLSLLGGVRVLIIPVPLAPQPKLTTSLRARGPLLALKSSGKAVWGSRKNPQAGRLAAWLLLLVLLLICSVAWVSKTLFLRQFLHL